MKSKSIYQIGIYTLFIGVILVSCSKDDRFDLTTFRGVVASGGSFEPVSESQSESNEMTAEEVVNGYTWKCTSKTVKAESANGGQGGFPTYNPNASVIYPGNLLQGASLDQATPDIIAVERSGGTISTDVIDGNIAPFFEVDQISKSQVTLALNNIIANSTGIIPANFDFQYYNVQSEEEFALKAKMSVKTLTTSFKGKLNFSSEKSYNRYVITLNQSYYTMSYDIPTSLESVFDPTVSPADLARYTGPGNPACYISDVTYGRVFSMLVESTSSIVDMDAAVSGAFKGIGTKVKGEVKTDYFKSLKDLKIQVFAFGGKDAQTLKTISTQGDLNSLVDILAEASDIRSGKPLSYVVRSVHDNQIVSVKLATEYDVKTCVPTIDPSAPPYTRHWAGLSAEFGGVGAAYSPGGTKVILINLAGTEYMESDISSLEGPFPISRLAGGQPCPVNGIGAMCRTRYNNTETYCFDETGGRFFKLKNNNWTQPKLISEMGPNNQLIVQGIGAAYLWGESDNSSVLGLMNNDGDYAQLYVLPQEAFSFGGDANGPYGAVGAAATMVLGEDPIYLIFDKLGTSYYVGDNIGGNSNLTGPFRI